jgi:hypothetical protein
MMTPYGTMRGCPRRRDSIIERQVLELDQPRRASVGPFADLYAAMSRADFLKGMVEDCLVDMASLRNQRIPCQGETWGDPFRAEERLFRQLDAIVTLPDDDLTSLVGAGLFAQARDPDLLFAELLALTCLPGSDGASAAIERLHSLDDDDMDSAEAVVEALTLGPNTSIGRAMIALLGSPRSLHRLMAIRVLSGRRELASHHLLLALHDSDPLVTAAAASAAEYLDEELDWHALAGVLDHSEEAPVRSALRTLVRHKRHEGIERATELCRTGRAAYADAALMLGLSGRRSSWAVLRNALIHEGSTAAARGVGFLGQIEAVPDLIDCLRSSDLQLQETSADALQRLTGAELSIAVSQPVHSSEESGTSDGLAESPTRTAADSDPQPWTRWWSRFGRHFDSRIRYRKGEPMTPATLLHDLATDPVDAAQRRQTFLELSILLGRGAPKFDPKDFIVLQEESLRMCKDWVRLSGSRRPPTSWSD